MKVNEDCKITDTLLANWFFVKEGKFENFKDGATGVRLV